jgi:hypothetical protein
MPLEQTEPLMASDCSANATRKRIEVLSFILTNEAEVQDRWCNFQWRSSIRYRLRMELEHLLYLCLSGQ